MELTLLDFDELFNDTKLDVLERYGSLAAITDLCVLLGSIPYNEKVSDDNSLKGRAGEYWTKTSTKRGGIFAINSAGFLMEGFAPARECTIRPVIDNKELFDELYPTREYINDNISIVKYGEYPQNVVSPDMQSRLNNYFKGGYNLGKTGKSYTFDATNKTDRDQKFEPAVFTEYEYNGKKYIYASVFYHPKTPTLSNGVNYKRYDDVWIEVSPVEWLVDEKSKKLISKRCLVSGLRFHSTKYDGNFENTTLKEYLDKYMLPELLSSKTNNKEDGDTTLSENNIYGFTYDNVSEEDIIKGCIDSNVSVFLHGKPSDGKSSRIKELDPDSEIIYMRNVTPDSLNGKSVYNSITNEMIDIPPTWYKKVVDKCEKEPDKIHLIFFDELTNALPSIQGMAFNIILDKEVNGKWKLPKNARIVAAGNDLDDSLAANQMVEPLFNRFAHVYIKTNVDNWLKWASTPKEKENKLEYTEEEIISKIHPAIYSYIAFKSMLGIDVLRTPYTGSEPNADPRKWEMASKILYKTKNPNMLRSLIGEALTIDFITFLTQKIISIEDVLNHNYNEDVIANYNISYKFAIAASLSIVDEKNVEEVRNFIKKLGKESRSLFDSLWTKGIESRLEIITELNMKDENDIKLIKKI